MTQSEALHKDMLRVRGFYRLQIEEDGEIVGDSGWRENTVTNEGKRDYLARLLGDIASSKQITFAAIGTGAAPAVGDTVLAGELTHQAFSRDAVAAATSGSTAVRFTGTFASATSHNTTTINASNIGLFQQSNTNTGTVFSGAAYASSSWATNQSVNYTYDITFT
ncbi:MAG: hypothetical protein V3V96_15810 [Acidiferrobacterales bacterium]